MATNPRHFVNEIARIIVQENLDGVDIDWEFPVGRPDIGGKMEDRINYVKMLRAIRSRLDALAFEKCRCSRYILTIASAASSWYLDKGFDLMSIADVIDWFNIMTYDYYGSWDSDWGKITGPVAPLFCGSPRNQSQNQNADWTVNYHYCNVKDRNKLVMGLPFYGHIWRNVLQDETKGQYVQLSNKSKSEAISYSELNSYLTKSNSMIKFDTCTRTPYAIIDRSLATYDDPLSMRIKVAYAIQKNLRGVMIWAINHDDTKLPLLSAIHDEVCHETNQKYHFEKNFTCSNMYYNQN